MWLHMCNRAKALKILTWTLFDVAISCHCTWARTSTSISFFNYLKSRSKLGSTATSFCTRGEAAPIGPLTIYWKYIISNLLNVLQFKATTNAKILGSQDWCHRLAASSTAKFYFELWSSMFRTKHPGQKNMLPKGMIRWKKNPICQIFHRNFFQKDLMKIDKMVDVFLNLTNFVEFALLTLVPDSGYTLTLKALIKVSKVSWTSQLSYM